MLRSNSWAASNQSQPMTSSVQPTGAHLKSSCSKSKACPVSRPSSELWNVQSYALAPPWKSQTFRNNSEQHLLSLNWTKRRIKQPNNDKQIQTTCYIMLSKFTKWYSNAFIQKRLKPRPKTFNWCLQRAAPFHAQAVHLLSHVVLQRGPIQWGGANPHVYIAIPRCTRTVHCKCWDMFFYLHEKLENPISNISWYFIQESERRSTSNIFTCLTAFIGQSENGLECLFWPSNHTAANQTNTFHLEIRFFSQSSM